MQSLNSKPIGKACAVVGWFPTAPMSTRVASKPRWSSLLFWSGFHRAWARFRLAGMHLNELMGMEVRGMPITAFFAPDTRRQVSDALEHVFEEPALARISLRGERGMGRSPITAELIILPLRSDLGDISRALGCLVCDGEIGRTPRRFDVCDLQLEPLFAGVAPRGAPLRVAPGFPHGEALPTDPAAPLAEGFAEGSTPLRDAPPIQTGDDMPEATARDNGEDAPRKPGKPTRVPWLRLVSTDD